MSGHCLLFSTVILARALKLLIVKTCATVAEGRQVRRVLTLRNNKEK